MSEGVYNYTHPNSAIVVECVNLACPYLTSWHPTTGYIWEDCCGPIAIYLLGVFDCPECGQKGEYRAAREGEVVTREREGAA
jgi:hypothetical protein